MADIEKTNGGTPKHGRFRKSTVPNNSILNNGGDITASVNLGSGKHEPVLPMFVQMNVRWDGVDTSWKEAARWVRFEEDIEESGKRWSKPYVPSVSLASFIEFKQSFANGMVALDVPGHSLDDILDDLCATHLGLMNDNIDPRNPTSTWHGPTSDSVRKKTLLSEHLSPSDRNSTYERSMSKIPQKILTVAQFGELKELLNKTTKLVVQANLDSRFKTSIRKMSVMKPSAHTTDFQATGNEGVPDGISADPRGRHNTNGDEDDGNLSCGSTSSFEDQDRKGGSSKIRTLRSNDTQHHPAFPRQQSSTSLNPFARKVPKGAESCVILAATVDFVTNPVVIWMRLKNTIIMHDTCELAEVTPTRFIGLVIRPIGETSKATEMGKVLGTLMSDQIFSTVAYHAHSKQTLLDELEHYTNEMTVLAPSAWDPSIRLEPPKVVPSVKKRLASASRQAPYTSSKHTRSQDERRVSYDEVRRRNQNSGGVEQGLIHEDDESNKADDEDDEDDNVFDENLEQDAILELEERKTGIDGAEKGHPDSDEESDEDDEALQRTGVPFGGLIKDVKRKLPWFWSDFTDALSPQCLASIIYIYLATVTKAITFGGFLGDITRGQQGVLEAFLGHALAGGAFCLFGGQPLTVVGCTGPVLIFEEILVNICYTYDINYMTFRLWIGLWSTLFCLIIVATDGSSVVRYFTRFTEEAFAALIGIIFVYKALEKLFKMSKEFKVHEDFNLEHLSWDEENCHCDPPTNLTSIDLSIETTRTNHTEGYDICFQRFEDHHHQKYGNESEFFLNSTTLPWGLLEKHECEWFGGHLNGLWCKYVPDVFFFSVLLFFGTFIAATKLKQFKLTPYFPTKIRGMVSDYAVILAILVFAAIDNAFHLQTPKLIVPTEFKPTHPDRGWIIPFLHPSMIWYMYILAAIPSLLLTILLFMDQQITTVIVNRKEHKLKKSFGYHLDMLVCGLMIGICSILGLPWCVAATVLCLGHIDSLKMETETTAPGEKPQFLGVREQRVTGVGVFILTGLSVKLAPILKYIPMPVLYGVLMYMGIASLKGMQFIDRIFIMFMPQKYQPDYIYLRHVQIKKVHIFTGIQILCLVLLWIIKSIKSSSLVFPLMVLALVGIRMMMDYRPLNKIFTQKDLYWLDQLMPGKKKKSEDAKRRNGVKRRTLSNCCGLRNRKKDGYVIENDNNDSNNPDAVLKFGNDFEKTSNQTGGRTTLSTNCQSDNLTSTLEPLIDSADNGKNIKIV